MFVALSNKMLLYQSKPVVHAVNNSQLCKVDGRYQKDGRMGSCTDFELDLTELEKQEMLFMSVVPSELQLFELEVQLREEKKDQGPGYCELLNYSFDSNIIPD
jgi:hypothetical protein